MSVILKKNLLKLHYKWIIILEEYRKNIKEY